MGIFGWSYPPGCSGPPDEPYEVCELSVETCNCPECPVCGITGRAECYQDHGLKRVSVNLAGLFNREMFEQACLGVADHFDCGAAPVCGSAADWADKLFEAGDRDITLADLNLLWLLYTEPMSSEEANAAVLYHTRRQ